MDGRILHLACVSLRLALLLLLSSGRIRILHAPRVRHGSEHVHSLSSHNLSDTRAFLKQGSARALCLPRTQQPRDEQEPGGDVGKRRRQRRETRRAG